MDAGPAFAVGLLQESWQGVVAESDLTGEAGAGRCPHGGVELYGEGEASLLLSLICTSTQRHFSPPRYPPVFDLDSCTSRTKMGLAAANQTASASVFLVTSWLGQPFL